MNKSGADEKQITFNKGVNFQPLASPDGKYVIFNSNRGGSTSIWRMNADGTDEKQLTDFKDGADIQFEFADGDKVSDYFAVTESPSHIPNETRIAFWSESTHEVDRIASIARSAGAKNIEGPGYEGEAHYAVFFEDPFGNRFEVCHRTRN